MWLYLPCKQTLFSPHIGNYQSFGIAVYRVSLRTPTRIAFIPDVSCDKSVVAHLARSYTFAQLYPRHLTDVVEDYL